MACSKIWVGIQIRQQIKTAVVINIFDDKGEVAAGVASVEAIVSFSIDRLKLGASWTRLYFTFSEKKTKKTVLLSLSLTQEKFLTPEWIQKFKHNIHSAPLLMVDANLNLPALEYSCQSKSFDFARNNFPWVARKLLGWDMVLLRVVGLQIEAL